MISEPLGKPFQPDRFWAIFALKDNPHSICLLHEDLCSRLIPICNHNLQCTGVESRYPPVSHMLLFQQDNSACALCRHATDAEMTCIPSLTMLSSLVISFSR